MKRIDNSQSALLKMQKEQEIKLAEVSNTLADWKYEAYVKGEEREKIDNDILRELHELKNTTEHLTKEKDFIKEMQHKDREHLHKFTEVTQVELNDKIINLKLMVDKIPHVLQE